MFTAAILAGGRASRFGGCDKSALVVGGVPIIERQLHVLRSLTDSLLIVANDPTRYRALNIPIVADLIAGAGALGGIYTAISAAPTSHTLVVACDLPFLSAPFLTRLVAAGQDVDVAIARSTDGYQPLCACYARTCAEPIRRRLDAGTLKVTDFFADVRVAELGPEQIAAYDPDGRLFLNVNTPEDYERAIGFTEGHGDQPTPPPSTS